MIIAFLILLLAVPAGFILAWMTRDELIEGRKWFRRLAIVFLLIGITFAFIGQYVIGATSIFMSIVSSISYFKSFDRKWTKSS